jgi:hypothetical protein
VPLVNRMSRKEKILHWLGSRAFAVYMSAVLAGVVVAFGTSFVLLVWGNVTVAEARRDSVAQAKQVIVRYYGPGTAVEHCKRFGAHLIECDFSTPASNFGAEGDEDPWYLSAEVVRGHLGEVILEAVT